MKKRILYIYLLVALMAAIPVLQSCHDNDENSLGRFIIRMATVRVISGNTYFLEIDNGNTLWPAASAIPWYRPVEGQRVIANYTPLGTLESYDEAVRVNNLINVLTKQVEELTAENEADYGDDPVLIEDMWIGANFLNIRFRFNIPFRSAHRVSLVTNTTTETPVIDSEGYVNLEYRYNTFNDQSATVRRSFVSFNLGEYGPQSATLDGIAGVKVKINSAVNGERIITFSYTDQDNDAASIENTDDLTNEGVE